MNRDLIVFLDSWLSRKVDQLRLPGLVVAIQKSNRITLLKAYNNPHYAGRKLKSQSLFRIASHSKVFTAILVMQLVQEGGLKLSDSLTKYLPWLSKAKESRYSKVTIRHLLSHSSGLARDLPGFYYWTLPEQFCDIEQLKGALMTSKLVVSPGKRFKYSNFGYAVLGLILESVCGKPYKKLLKERILAPLGLKNTFFDYASPLNNKLARPYSRIEADGRRPKLKQTMASSLVPAAGLCSNAQDLCRLANALFQDNHLLLNAKSKALMVSVPISVARDSRRYGLGLETIKLGRRKIIGHGGAFTGYATRTYLDPKDELVISLLCNCIDAPIQKLTGKLFKVFDFFVANSVKNVQLRRFTGTFYSIWGVSQVVLARGRLWIVSLDEEDPIEGAIELKQVGPTLFRTPTAPGFASPEEILEFEFDKKGQVAKFSTPGGFIMLRRDIYLRNLKSWNA